ncbi:MAG TPA: hypothetical protein VKY37_01820 [Brumimicrobium sp.]|nr:hypothetical protein [Brumimicrobium sp.]
MIVKKYNVGISLVMALAFLFVSYNLSAQYSYQSVVRDANGDLLANQDVGMKVTIYEKNNLGGGTTDVYEETHTVTTNDNGLVSIVLGGGTTVSGSMNDINWSGRSVNSLGIIYVFTNKIKVQYDLTGGSNYTLTSEEIIREVPRASFAEKAENSNNGAVAYASIDSDATILSQKGVESVEFTPGGSYKIKLDGIDYDPTKYVAIATISIGRRMISTQASSSGGYLIVYAFDLDGSIEQSKFQIAVFKP